MSAGKPETSAEAMEQELAARLASFDELLKAGDTSRAQKVTPHDGREASPDLERAQDCLRLLEAVWPRAVTSSPTLRGLGPAGSLAPLRPASAPVQLGRFLIRRQLGRGGFGTVYLADDCHLHREVALKVPHTDAFVDNDLRARFQQEARAAASLDHPNLVQVYEAGEIDSVAYIALAYCPGINLADWLKQRTEPVPCVAAAELVVTLASAVHHAHQNGVVHRDLKPSNILLVPSDGEAAVSADDLPVPLVDGHWPLHKLAPKITDFGLAKHAGARAPLTRTGTILGTPCYMAPEQTGNTGVTTGPAADVYSLGAILYELLTHRPPFQGDSPLEVLQQVRFQEPLTLRRLRPSLPRDLDTICLKCLEKDPAKRYTSAGALAADLRRYLDHKPIQARPVGMLGRTGKWIRRRPATAALVSVSSVAAVLLLVILIVSDVEIRQKHQEAERANQRLEFANTLIRREKDHAEKALQRERRVSYFRSIALAHHRPGTP